MTSAVTSAVQAELDDAVADEDIAQERADDVMEEVPDWLADGGEPFRRVGHRHGGAPSAADSPTFIGKPVSDRGRAGNRRLFACAPGPPDGTGRR